MADINLTTGNDDYTQPESNKNDYNNYFGLAGNDTIRAYQGTLIGGAGADVLVRLPVAGEPWRQVGVAYWDSPAGIVANLAEGWVDDGWGTRDTVTGITIVHGSGRNDRFIGDAADNFFYPNGGTDTLDGGAGYDGFDVREIPPNADGSGTWRPATLADLNITVSPDGRNAVVSVKHFPKFTYTVTDMEYFRLVEPNSKPYLLADYITPESMAQQAIAAGGASRWNATGPLGTAVNLSFSFVTQAPASGPGASGFRPFNAAEQQVVRDLLAATSRVSGLTFTEVAESGNTVGQLRFGASQQAATKGVAFLPGQNGDQAGDVWMDVDSLAVLTPGSEGYAALLHEIGHALGLRHPRNVDAGDAWAMQLREQDDRTSLTVMSQTPSSDGLFRADWGPLDVLALRYLYGSKTSNPGDTRYALGVNHGSSQNTLVDDGGNDTIDASALSTGVSLDLVPGHLGSAGVTPAGFSGVENLGLTSGTQIENAIGTAFDDVLVGNDMANALTGGLGNDWIDGGAGNDIAAFAGRRTDYEIANEFGKVYVKARDGISGFDTLLNIERLQFGDQLVTLSPTVLGSDAKFRLDEDTSLSAALPAPTDVAATSVSYRMVGAASHGSASIGAGGQLQYTPAANFSGIDTVAFDMVGASGVTNRYVAYIDVLPVNDAAPVGRDGSYLAASNGVLQGRLPAASDFDGDPLSYALGTDPRNGAVAIGSDGSFAYTPKTGYRGDDSFAFTVSDGMGGSTSYTARVLVAPAEQTLLGTAGADVMPAQTSADAYAAGAGNDRITGGAGDDLIDGGDGIDTSIYAGARGSYRLTKTDYGWTVADSRVTEGTDRIANLERLKFADTSVALDLDGNAGMVAQILRALFGKQFLADKAVVGLGLMIADGGMSYPDLVTLAIGTDAFAQLAGGRSNTAFVNAVYKNVVGFAPSATDLAGFVGLLDSGQQTQASLGLIASQLSLNAQSVELVGLATTGLEFVPQGG